MLRKIDNCRLEKMKAFTHLGLLEDIRWLIEVKVRLAGEFQDSYNRFIPGMGRSSYSKKRRAKRMGVCHKCARWTCDARCRNIGMASINREDKIQFLKDGLSKELLDDIRLTLETHPCGQDQRYLLIYWKLFKEKKEHNSRKKLTVKDSICQIIRKLDRKQILNS